MTVGARRVILKGVVLLVVMIPWQMRSKWLAEEGGTGKVGCWWSLDMTSWPTLS